MNDRDEFAKAAMNGLASNMGAGKPYNLDLVARQAYEIADAMLRAREVPHKSMEQIADEYLRLKRENDHIADVIKMVLTDAEREAVAWAERFAQSQRDSRDMAADYAATLRGLLERLK